MTLCLMAFFLHALPYSVLMFVPVIAAWGLISAGISGFVMLFIDEWLDDE